jgi:hypothetical protein
VNSEFRARFLAINGDRHTGRDDVKHKDDRPKDPIHEEPQMHRAKPRVSASKKIFFIRPIAFTLLGGHPFFLL